MKNIFKSFEAKQIKKGQSHKVKGGSTTPRKQQKEKAVYVEALRREDMGD